MNYYNIDIVLQEIPGEISLCISITGCKMKCNGCHSEHLWDSKNGEYLSSDILESMLNKYKNTISCVVFMGGEWQPEELYNHVDFIKNSGIKCALYTGFNIKQISKKIPKIINKLDYIKVGRWIPTLGGLNSNTTNQYLIRLSDNKVMNYLFK